MRIVRGFSFVELMASVAIVGLLASIAIPLAETSATRSKEVQLRRALREIRGAIDEHKMAASTGRIATTPQASGYPPTLQDLVIGVDDLARPGSKLYFLRRIPRDPFHPDAQSPAAETWGKRSFASPPDSPREGDDVFDVYSLSNARALNGTMYADW
ncbi:MAG: type II secretion system protein [Rhodocyclaceae bacterium]|nr:type II secretion system protein [Rhodocyclaceae bacterium]